MKCDLVLVAGGSSSRFGADIPKQFQTSAGKPLFLWSLEVFLTWPALGEVVVVVPQDWVKPVEDGFGLLIETKKIQVVSGGSSRQASTNEGLKKLEQISDSDWVAVHDAARACVTEELINTIWGECQRRANDEEFGGAVPGVKVNETIKVVENGVVRETLNRDKLCAIQTPQIVRRPILQEAIKLHTDSPAFDDASLIEKMGRKIVVVEGSSDNLKVTHQEDLERATNWLRKRHPQI